jgi:hypothetical protein
VVVTPPRPSADLPPASAVKPRAGWWSSIWLRSWALGLGVLGIVLLAAVGKEQHGLDASTYYARALGGPLTVAGWTSDWIVPIAVIVLAAIAHPLHPRPWTVPITWAGCGCWWFCGFLALAAGC